MITVAKSLDVLLDQINSIAPHRSKISDGALGDKAHSARHSDHNPNSQGVITARDFTHDPLGGFDSYRYAEILRLNRDSRLKYVISNRRISNPDIDDGSWRPFHGLNPHNHHMHVSVHGDYECSRVWNLHGHTELFDHNPMPAEHIGTIKDIQDLLIGNGFKLKPSGYMDKHTTQAIIAFQRAQKLVQDGLVGPYTSSRLKAFKSQWPPY